MITPPKILLVEDDAELSALLSELLQLDGFSVEAAITGSEGLEKALLNTWDIIVLDIMLPEIDGLEILKNLRPQITTPVMMLTARGDELDRIVGFELGADDYLPKPFNPRELSARLKAMLRRVKYDQSSSAKPESSKLTFGIITINQSSREVLVDGEQIPLTQVEFDLLVELVKQPGTVFKKEHLYEAILKRKFALYDRALDVHISNLRKKLHDAGVMNDPIKTIRGVGYLFSSSTDED